MCKDGKLKKEVVKALEPKHIQVDDKVYSATALASVHPGGDLFVKAFAGRDATDAFISYHRRRFPHSKMEAALVSTAAAAKKAGTDDDYIQLCELVDKIVPRNQSFGSSLYFAKVFIILGSAFALEVSLLLFITLSYVTVSFTFTLRANMFGISLEFSASSLR